MTSRHGCLRCSRTTAGTRHPSVRIPLAVRLGGGTSPDQASETSHDGDPDRGRGARCLQLQCAGHMEASCSATDSGLAGLQQGRHSLRDFIVANKQGRHTRGSSSTDQETCNVPQLLIMLLSNDAAAVSSRLNGGDDGTWSRRGGICVIQSFWAETLLVQRILAEGINDVMTEGDDGTCPQQLSTPKINHNTSPKHQIRIDPIYTTHIESSR